MILPRPPKATPDSESEPGLGVWPDRMPTDHALGPRVPGGAPLLLVSP